MAKRDFKLFALALSFLVGRSFLALVEIPRTTQNRYRRSSRTARSVVEPPTWATCLDPIASAVGISLRDIGKQVLDANSNARSLNKLKPLVDVSDAYEHARLLANKLVERAKKSQEARNIFLPNISLPLIPVNGTEFQHLVRNVLSDVTLTGVSAIHAEPGTGKSVAVALAMLTWAKHNPKCITVLIRGNLKLLKDLFRVSDEAYVTAVAENVFPILSDEGVRLQLVLDNIFDKEVGERGEMLMSLARAAFKYGQVVVVTQSREVAEEVGSLNGARTRVSPQQKCNVSEYRWNEMQASRLLLNLNATAKMKDWRKSRKTRWWHKMLHTFTRTTKESEDIAQRALTESLKEFKQDGAWVRENLEGARMPDGGWKPVDIEQFLLSGIKPVLVPAVAGATSPTQTKAVWVRQLQKDGEKFELVGNAFQVKGELAELENVDDLKEAICSEMIKSCSYRPDMTADMNGLELLQGIKKRAELSIASFQIDIYSSEDGKWIREDEETPVNRGTSKTDCYGFAIPST